MNIDRVNSGMPIQQARRIARTVDLTISDRGVNRTRTEERPLTRLRAEEASGKLVTSTRELQALLSPEEIRALRESFSVSGLPSENETEASTYGIDGMGKGNRRLPSLGSLVDITG